MTRISTFSYSIKQGLKNIYRNRRFSLASIGTIATCLFMFGIFYFVLSNFQFMVKNAESSVGITLFFEEGTTEKEILAYKGELENREEVLEISYISPEQAWEKFCEENFHGDAELMASFGEDNPLKDSASLEIKLHDITKQNEFISYVSGLEKVRQVNSSDATAKTFSSFNVLLGYVSAAIIIILLAVAVFLISTTVTMGISVRRDEIAIMRLVGATDAFIRAPFIVEGVVIGIFGTLIPLGILYGVYHSAISYIQEKFHVLSNLLTFLSVNEVFRTLVPISLIIGIGIGFFGSFITVRKHLRV